MLSQRIALAPQIQHIGAKQLADGATGVEVVAENGALFAGKKCVIAAGYCPRLSLAASSVVRERPC